MREGKGVFIVEGATNSPKNSGHPGTMEGTSGTIYTII